jgi:hypothetical protein
MHPEFEQMGLPEHSVTRLSFIIRHSAFAIVFP